MPRVPKRAKKLSLRAVCPLFRLLKYLYRLLFLVFHSLNANYCFSLNNLVGLQ
jgi:hypothetical protein